MARDIRRALQSESLKRDEPSYYQLLGLQEFEQDERRIAQAAEPALGKEEVPAACPIWSGITCGTAPFGR